MVKPFMRRPVLGSLQRALSGLTAARPVTIVMYHSIGTERGPYTLSPAAFRRQIEFIRQHYPIARLRDIGRVLLGPGPVQHSVVITFDDGLRDFLQHAYPVIESYGVSCTMFVPTGRVGCRDHMTEDQLPVLASEGLVDLGSHTIDHLSMRQLPLAEMRRQAIESKRALESLAGSPVTMFAYPFGQPDNFSALTSRVLAESGYEIAVTSCWGTMNSARRMLALRRIFFDERDTEADLEKKIEGGYDWRAVKERVGFTARLLVARPTGSA